MPAFLIPYPPGGSCGGWKDGEEKEGLEGEWGGGWVKDLRKGREKREWEGGGREWGGGGGGGLPFGSR